VLSALTPRLLRRGLELFALISLAGVVGLLLWQGNFAAFVDAMLGLKLGWLAAGLGLASMDWVGGGLRLWLVTRHVNRGVRYRDMVLASGFGAWGAYLTPFQSGASPMMVWSMRRAGVRLPEAMTAVFITFVATVAFFAIAGPLAIFLGAGRSLEEHGLGLGITLYDLFRASLTLFGVIGGLMLIALMFPRGVRNLVHAIAVRLGGRGGRLGGRMEHVTAGIDRAHECLVAFGSPQGLLVLASAVVVSGPSHANKLLAGFVALRALGIEANFYDILLLQTLITFLLYFAPTPGASGLAEVLSGVVMQIYVDRSHLASYTLLWRFINSYATVMLGSAIFWYWLRTGLVGREEPVAVMDEGDFAGP
jgi:hypothetical protein